MPNLKDTPEGSTHHDKDACYKCKTCDAHGYTEDSVRHCAKNNDNLETRGLTGNEEALAILNQMKENQKSMNNGILYNPNNESKQTLETEINTRLYYALGDIEPTSEKMLRAVTSMKDIMKEREQRIRKDMYQKIDEEMMNGKLRDEFDELFPKDQDAIDGIAPSKSKRSQALLIYSMINAFIKKISESAV
jgi:hypothetical protein